MEGDQRAVVADPKPIVPRAIRLIEWPDTIQGTDRNEQIYPTNHCITP